MTITKKIIEAIGTNLDLNQVLFTICKEISEIFKVDRAAIEKFEPQGNYSKLISIAEFSSIENVIKHKELTIPEKVTEYLGKTLLDEGKDIIIDNIDDVSVPDFYREFHHLLGTKSILNIPIKKGADKWGIIAIFQNSYYRHWKKQEIELIHTVVDYIYVAIRQSELYSALKQTNENQQAILNNIPFMAWLKDIDGKYIAVNNYLCQAFNLKPEEIVGKTDFDINPRDLAEEYRKDDMEVMNTALQKSIEEHIVTKDGRGWAETYKSPIYNSKGSIIGTTGIAKDITERKKAELELLRKQKLIIAANKRERLLRKVIEAIRSSLDIGDTLNIISEEISKVFKAERVMILEFPNKQDLTNWNIKFDYINSSNMIPSENVPLDPNGGIKWGDYLFIKGKNLSIDDIQESNISDPLRKNCERLGIKSLAGTAIRKGEEIWGSLAIAESKSRHWTKEEISLLETISDQIYTAITQAELYSVTKKQAEREKLLRKITENIRNNLDLNEFKKNVVNEIGKTFRADRCFFRSYDKTKDIFIASDAEYLSSPDIKSLKDIEVDKQSLKYFLEELKKRKIGSYPILIDEEFANSTPLESYFKSGDIKADYAVPIFYKENTNTYLVLHYSKIDPKFDENDKKLLETIAHQIAIAFDQAILFDTIKQAGEREKLLRRILETIRSTLDIDEIKNKLLISIGRAINANRCFIADYDQNSKEFLPIKNEYLSSPDQKSMIGVDINLQFPHFAQLNMHKKDNIIPDAEKFYKEAGPEFEPKKKQLEKYNVKSDYGIAITYANKIIGILVNHFTEKKCELGDEDIQFLRILADQVGTALYKAMLFEKEKKTSERENFLRKIITLVRSTFDISQIKKNFVIEVGKYFKANRVAVLDYFEETNTFGSIDEHSEYLSSNEEKSFKGIDVNKYVEGRFFMENPETLKNLQIQVYNDKDKFIRENNLYGTLTEKYIHEYSLEAGAMVTIEHTDHIYGTLFLQYTRKGAIITKDDVDFIKTLAGQLGTGIYHARVYEKEKKISERERTLRKIIEMVRSTFDIDKIKQNIVNEVGISFKADRCYFRLFDKEKHFLLSPDIEYVASPEIDRLKFFSFPKEVNEYFLSFYEKEKDIIIPDADLFIESPNPESMKKILKENNIKSTYGFYVFSEHEFIGTFAVQYVKNKVFLDNDDIELLRSIAKQSGIAIKQSNLFNAVKQNEEKERILREIITELKPFQNVEDTFNYLLSKIAKIYDVSRTTLIGIPVQENEKPSIRYEYLKNENVPSIKMTELPEACLEMFKDIIETHNPVIVSDTKYLHPDNISMRNFFETYSIGAFIGNPLVRYNQETKLLGILFICSDKPRNWSSKDSDLFTAINESVVNVIWEILKTIEVNRLRDTFVTTLAHDLQVPIIGDIKALEFLNSRPEKKNIGTFKEIIGEVMNNDKRILAILKTLLESYQYEAGKKELKLINIDLRRIINTAIAEKKHLADSKNISIETFIADNLPDINADKEEISKVISIFLDNSVNYVQNGGHIIINAEHKNNSIITCIADNGPGIPANIIELIFKRYEMAIEFERKIGAGISLYLAKQIIDAHKGKIWYTTEIDKGSTFCFSLAVN